MSYSSKDYRYMMGEISELFLMVVPIILPLCLDKWIFIAPFYANKHSILCKLFYLSISEYLRKFIPRNIQFSTEFFQRTITTSYDISSLVVHYTKLIPKFLKAFWCTRFFSHAATVHIICCPHLFLPTHENEISLSDEIRILRSLISRRT